MQKAKIFLDCHVFDGNFQGTTTYRKGLYTELSKDKTIQFSFGASDTVLLATILGTDENRTKVSYKA